MTPRFEFSMNEQMYSTSLQSGYLARASAQDALGIDDAIGIVNSVDDLVGESATTQTDEVDTRIADRFLASNDVGRNVLRGATATLEHDVTTHMQELMEQATS